MIRLPPRSPRTDTLFPSKMLFRSAAAGSRQVVIGSAGRRPQLQVAVGIAAGAAVAEAVEADAAIADLAFEAQAVAETIAAGAEQAIAHVVFERAVGAVEIGRAPVWTPVTNAHIVCRILL